MSLYNMMCGTNPCTALLLSLIDLDYKQIPRFRDVWVNREFTEITVFTRTGGGNRDEYKDQNLVLMEHPFYLRDSDCDFDSTFALFVFSLPDSGRFELIDQLNEAVRGTPEDEEGIIVVLTMTAKTKFDLAMEALKSKEGSNLEDSF